MHRVLGTTRILGVIGYPVSHSLSPVMHNAALAAMDLDYVYIALPVAIADLATAINGLKAIFTVEGFNLTIPHKQEIVPLLDEITDTARVVGAVNTVKRVGNDWIGTNTDVDGFLAPLHSLERDWKHTPALVLGSGGAARAVVAGCAKLGCPIVRVVGRDRDKLHYFSETITTRLPDCNLQVHLRAELDDFLKAGGLVVNTTPMGMGSDPNSPVTAAQVKLLPPDAIAYDLIYTPRPTQFLKLAQARGLMVVDGLEMLLHQGAIALEFWLERSVPIAVMQQALLDRLK